VSLPVLILLDRTADLPTALHHAWTYQALTHDVLDIRLNRVTIEVHCALARSPHRAQAQAHAHKRTMHT
jgi:hypothetical protein